jgi:hypothetical protein
MRNLDVENMVEEIISRRGTMLVRRLILAPGEATPWHVDPFHRLTVIIRGDVLAIERREGGDAARVDVIPGMSDWDEPTEVVHRAVNVGQDTYEEVTLFFLDGSDTTPQPRVD